MTARIDTSQVDAFARKLEVASHQIEEEASQFEEYWGGVLVDELQAGVAVDTGHLRDSIEQVEPGGITFGGASYGEFLERGTATMAPQPFIAPAIKRIRTRVSKDAGERAVKLIQHGR
jgi:HK97 gp10 family phage protein